jgi:hypothetical protein
VAENTYLFLKRVSFSKIVINLQGKRPLGRPTIRWDGDTCEDAEEFRDYVYEINVRILQYRQFTYSAFRKLLCTYKRCWK